MQRRQLTQLEKNEVVKAQLRETWERSDAWIGKDLGGLCTKIPPKCLIFVQSH